MTPSELKKVVQELRQRIGRAISGDSPDRVALRWLAERDEARNAGDALAHELLDLYRSNGAISHALAAVARYAETAQHSTLIRDVDRLRTH